MGGGGDSGPQTVYQINKQELSPEQKKIFNLAFPLAEQAASKPLEVYPGQGIVGFNPTEMQAMNMAKQVALGDQIGGAAATANQFLLDPALLSPESNPYLQQYGNFVAETMGNQFTQQIAPAIRSGATMSGGMFSGGSSREGIAQGLAAGETARATGGTLANLYSQAYQSGLGAMGDALKTAPLTQAGQLFGTNVMSAVGGQQRMLDQALLDDAIQKFYLEQQLPMLQAKDLMGLVTGMPGGAGVSAVSGATPSASPVMSGLGGAMAGGVLGSTLFGASMGGPVGAGLGLLAGLLFS